MLRFLAMLLWLAWASTALGQPAQRRPSVDGCGDPLPDGAVAHWGTAHFRVGYGIAACSLSADGRWLAVTAPVNHVDVLDAWTGKRHWFGRSICANDPLFSADSRYVLCGDEVGVLVVREAATGKVFGRFSLAIDRRLRSWFGPPFVALSADARTLALGFYSARDQQRITARDVPSGQVKFQRVVPVGDGVGIALSPDGQLLSWWGPRTNIADEAVSKAIQQHRRTLHLFKLPTGQELHQFKLDRGHLNVVLFSPDGKTLVAASKTIAEPNDVHPRDLVWIWDVATGKERHRLSPEPGSKDMVRALSFAPNGRTLATVNDDGTVRLFDLATGAIQARFRNSLHQSPPSRATLSTFSPFPSSWPQSAVSFLPDGRILACGAPHQTTAEIWDIRMQRAWRPALPGHQHQVSNLAFTPDGGLLSVSYDSAIHRWGLKPDVMPRRLPEFDHDRWWPEGKYCLSTDGRSIARASMNMKVWRTADGKALWEEEAPRHHNPSSSPDLTFVASNTMLVRIDNTGVVDRWDAATGRRRKEIRGIRDIGATALSPDGHILVVVPYQWPPKGVINVQVWDLLRGRCLRQIRGARDPELADPQPGW